MARFSKTPKTKRPATRQGTRPPTAPGGGPAAIPTPIPTETPVPAGPPDPARPLMADLMDALALRNVEAERAAAGHNQQQAILHALIQDAKGGDARSAQILIGLKREGDAAQGGAPEPGEMSAEDRAVLADLAEQLRQASPAEIAAAAEGGRS